MKKTKFMERIFSAIENDEKELTNQINHDLDMAMEDGNVDTEEYSMKKMSDNEVEIHDKVNDEDTIAKVGEDNVELTAKECDTKNFDWPTAEEIDKQIEEAKAKVQELINKKAEMMKNKEFSDSPWYIVTKDGKTVFTGNQNECRSEWLEKGYKIPDYMVTPVTMEPATPETTPSVKAKKTFSTRTNRQQRIFNAIGDKSNPGEYTCIIYESNVDGETELWGDMIEPGRDVEKEIKMAMDENDEGNVKVKYRRTIKADSVNEAYKKADEIYADKDVQWM